MGVANCLFDMSGKESVPHYSVVGGSSCVPSLAWTSHPKMGAFDWRALPRKHIMRAIFGQSVFGHKGENMELKANESSKIMNIVTILHTCSGGEDILDMIPMDQLLAAGSVRTNHHGDGIVVPPDRFRCCRIFCVTL